MTIWFPAIVIWQFSKPARQAASNLVMAKKFPLHPKHPERICWGCDKYCPAKDLQCGNGSGRTQHPAEMLGDDWYQWGDWGIEDAPDPTATLDEA